MVALEIRRSVDYIVLRLQNWFRMWEEGSRGRLIVCSLLLEPLMGALEIRRSVDYAVLVKGFGELWIVRGFEELWFVIELGERWFIFYLFLELFMVD